MRPREVHVEFTFVERCCVLFALKNKLVCLPLYLTAVLSLSLSLFLFGARVPYTAMRIFAAYRRFTWPNFTLMLLQRQEFASAARLLKGSPDEEKLTRETVH